MEKLSAVGLAMLALEELPLSATAEDSLSALPIVNLRTEVDLTQYHNLIVKLAADYWRKLPPDAKGWIDLDDAVAEGMLCAYLACQRWDPSRGKPITLIQTAVRNMFVNKLAECFARKRFCLPVAIDDCDEDRIAEFSAADPSIDQHASKAGVERILEDASQDTRRFLSDYLFGPEPTTFAGARALLAKVGRELRSLIAEHRVSISDFRAVLDMKG